MGDLKQNIREIVEQIPQHVTINAASKFRSPQEVITAIEAGIRHIGFNYIQEGIKIITAIPNRAQVKFHLIGHLQSNKVKLAVEHFDSIDTVHSYDIAKLIHKQALGLNKYIEVLVQVKDQSEKHKNGVFLKDLKQLIMALADFPNLKVKGLMAMGAASDGPEELREFFKQCRASFNALSSLKQPNLEPMVLSMGMSASYKIAIEQGATQIRLGNLIYGPKPKPT